MSHYNVAVFFKDINDIDALLAPFDERVDAGSPYAEFVEDDESELDKNHGQARILA